MTATIAGVEVEVSLALGLEAGTGRWDDPAAAWGAFRWGQPDSALGDWLDLTCQCSAVHLQSGGREPDPIVPLPVAATASLLLHGAAFDPWQGNWAGLIGEGTLARVRARKAGSSDPWSIVIDGMVTRYAYDPLELRAEVELTDRMMLLNADLPAVDPAVGAGETASARQSRLLDRAGWTGSRDLTPGGVTMLATTLDGPAITSMRTVAESDMGWLLMTRAGTVVYRPGGFELAASPVATLTVCPLEPPPQLPYSWAWTTGTGTITPTATGVLIRPDPRGGAATWNCRATSTASLPGRTYRAVCRARLVAGTPNGQLALVVGSSSLGINPTTTVNIPTDGSWVQLDATAAIDLGASTPKAIVYMRTGGTAQVTVEVEQLVMVDVTGLAYDPTKPVCQLVTVDTRQDGELLNVCSISRQSDQGTEADTATARDEPSVARYGPRTYRRTDLQHETVGQSQRIASTLVARSAWPSQPPAAVELNTALDPTAGLLLLTLDPGARVDLIGPDGTLTGLLVAGWDVELDSAGIRGDLYVAQTRVVTGTVWDRMRWDVDRWEAA